MIALGAAVRLSAQQQATTFEGASLKPGQHPQRAGPVVVRDGTFTASQATLRELVRIAYGVQQSQVVDGPEWAGTERYDVIAKVESRVPATGVMLQRLLADRFQLV